MRLVRICSAAVALALVSALPVTASNVAPGTEGLTRASGQADADSGGFTSENVEWVTVMPQHTGTAGGKLVGDHYYMTDPRGVWIYDASEPAAPVLVGELPAAQIGLGLALAQEEPDTNGEILLVNAYVPNGPAGPSGATSLQVIDVSDPSAPKSVGAISASAHTWSCILDCTYAIAREGHVIDLRDPTKPENIGNWKEVAPFAGYVHDFEEVSKGKVIASGQPSIYMDFKDDPVKPKILSILNSEFHSLGYHGSTWARKGKDRILLMGAEVAPQGSTNAAGSDCTDEGITAVTTYDTKDVLKAQKKNRFTGESFRKLHDWRVAGRGAYADGNAPAHTLYCGHWFDTHPKWKNGGTLAMAHYDWGTRFLDVNSKGEMEEIGYFQPVRGYTGSAKWIDNEIVYVHDYFRGLDVLRFTE